MAKRSKRRLKPLRLKVRSGSDLRLETLEPRQMLTTFYVDGGAGDDSSDGQSLSTPFATIQAAATAAEAGDTVLIRGGVYREEVDVLRSGSAAAPIIFSAYQGEEVVVAGADLVTGWTPAPSVGPNVWQATANWNAEGNRNGNTLFVNGEFEHEARQFGENDLLDIDDWGLLRNGQVDDGISSFVVNDLGAFPNDFWNGGKVKFHIFDYAFATKTISDFNSSTGRITFDSPIGVATQKQDNGYYIFDTINALDKPGEWFKADGSDTLYYQADSGQDPNSLEIGFKRRAYGFDISGRDHLQISGITFRGASINAGSNADNNLIEGNRFYAYDKAGIGRISITGDNNTVHSNEFSHTWSSAIILGGVRNALVNNHLHDIGFDATTRAIGATSASELLVSHNTVQKFARSFMDGYPVRSEIAYNVFEDGGRLSWDTGVFDSDGGGGNASYSIFHHNIFRDNSESRGIFEAFYGLNNNAVVHHNLFYDYTEARPALRAAGTEFRQLFHNTVISNVGQAPAGQLEARNAIGTRYNNNVQISVERMEALGVDVRGNFNYSPSDFVNFGNDDYRLAPGSAAIDAGIPLPGINDGFLGAAPDAGAFEFGAPAWEAGHDFATPPNPSYAWFAVPGTNLFDNGQFLQGIGDWTAVSGTPNSLDRNSWNLAPSGAALTGTFRTQSVEFTPGESIRRTFTGLKPNTTYSLGSEVRVVNRFSEGNGFTSSSGSISSGTYRGEGYVTGLSAGEWVEYRDVDFGEAGQFDQLDILHIRNPAQFSSSLDGVGVEVRLDSPTGQLLTEFADLRDGGSSDRWRADRAGFAEIFGEHSLFFSVTGSNAANLAIGSLRLLKSNLPADDLLTVKVSSNGGQSESARLGSEDWKRGYEDVIFKTGPLANSAVVEFANGGRINAYLDRIYLIEGFDTRGATPRNLTVGALAYQSAGSEGSNLALSLTDGSAATEVITSDDPGSWVQVDLNSSKSIYSIELTAPAEQPARLSNFRVSVWSANPDSGGTIVWSQDYLTGSQTLDAGEVLQIQPSAVGSDGEIELNTARGRFVRVELLGENNLGDERLALSELKILGFDLSNLAITDSTVTQSTTAGGQSPELAVDNDSATQSETEATDVNSWWQTRFSQPFSIGQIELQNRDDSLFSDLSNFKVSVWDEDQANGGTKLWEKSYFGSGSVGRGETFLIDGSETNETSTRRLASVHTGRVVRIELIGANNNGNGRLSLVGVRVASSDTAPPIANAAQRGVASQSADFYGDVTTDGSASDANDGLISTASNFSSALAEPGVWWQVELDNPEAIEQIVLFNRTDAANRLNNFRVSVWDDDPDNGGTELWGRNHNYSSSAPTYGTGLSIGAGGALIIDGSDSSGGTRLDATTDARYVRVQLLGSNILSLPEVQVWTGSNSIDLGATQTAANFDFGTTTSPVQSGWLGVTPNTYGDVRWSRSIGSGSRASGGSINRDFVSDTDEATLSIAVPNGVYDVTLNLGDANATRDNMMVWAESELISDDIDSPAGQFSYIDAGGASATPKGFEVVVRDGELNLRFDDSSDGQGSEAGWVLNRLSLVRVGDIPPGPDNALQLLVDANGGGLLRNTTGAAVSLVGYTISSDQAALLPNEWVGLGDQQYDGTSWTESSTTVATLAESGAPIVIPNGGQVYLGQVLDMTVSPTATLQFQLEGEQAVDGYFAAADFQSPRLLGDFNEDLRVDAADYTVWRDRVGDTGASFAGSDANGDSRIDHSDRVFWQARYGDSLSVTSLIDTTTGNGSFEDWGPQDALTRFLANNSTASLPGWTVSTTGNGGWIRQGDAAATVGASSDGIAYAIGTAGATVELTSDTLSHVTAEGDEFLITLDVGSRDGADNNYQVALVFGGQERAIATIVDGPNAATEGLATHEVSYTASAADAGLSPALRVTWTVTGFSQAFVDSIGLRVAGGGSVSTSLATVSSPAISIGEPDQQVEQVTPSAARFAEPIAIDQAFFFSGESSDTSDSDPVVARVARLATEFPVPDSLLFEFNDWADQPEAGGLEESGNERSDEETDGASDEAFLAFGQSL